MIPRGAGAPMVLVGSALVGSIVGIAVLAPYLTPFDPTQSVAPPLEPPSSNYLMGTTRLGYDMFSRIVYGARTILMVVLLSTIGSMAAGIPLGLVSGYSGGLVDRGLTTVMDSMYVFPSIILAIAIAAALGPGIFNTTLAIAIVYVPTYFRMVRGQTLSVREYVFVDAMRSIGARTRTIMFSHILPNILPAIVVVFSLNVADAVLTEAALSFFGLSVPAPTPDWGYDLRAGQEFLPSGLWWLITFPGMMIILLAVGFSLLGEGLNELIAPWISEK